MNQTLLKGENWSCASWYTPGSTLGSVEFGNIMWKTQCNKQITLDWDIVYALNPCKEKTLTVWQQAADTVTYYDYVSIPSIMEHKSPTLDEIKWQISGMSAPNLPIDKDRYVDFIAANWDYQK